MATEKNSADDEETKKISEQIENQIVSQLGMTKEQIANEFCKISRVSEELIIEKATNLLTSILDLYKSRIEKFPLWSWEVRTIICSSIIRAGAFLMMANFVDRPEIAAKVAATALKSGLTDGRCEAQKTDKQ